MLALVWLSKAVVSVDTGTAYVAVSMGKPTVVVYTHIEPYQRLRPQQGVAWVQPQGVPCAPCGDFEWPNAPCRDGDFAACAKSITAEQILHALQKVVVEDD